MKLSPAQISTLKKLISYKGYPEIDLQYEILDHVACKVEVLLDKILLWIWTMRSVKSIVNLGSSGFLIWQNPTPKV